MTLGFKEKFKDDNIVWTRHISDLYWGDREDMDTELIMPEGNPIICIHMDNDLWSIRKINQKPKAQPDITDSNEIWDAFWEHYYEDEWRFDSLYDFIKALTNLIFIYNYKTKIWEIPDEVWKVGEK